MSISRTATRASMADVARLARVSTQTVSRYFTGTGYVRDETRERITAAVEELGYVVNQSARNLRVQHTNTVGVLSMGGLNFGSAGVLTGLGIAARAAGYNLITAQLDLDLEAHGWEGDARRALSGFLSAPVDGVVVSSPLPGIDAFLQEWDHTVPLLKVSEIAAGKASAGTHSFAAAREATAYLISLGHRRILHVAGPETRNEAVERERGYREAMLAADLEPDVVNVAGDWSSATGYRAGEIADPTQFTAVFAANDGIALGFLSAMRRRGVQAPEHYSIVGVDDMPEAAYFAPPLTTMRMDFKALGVATFRMLHTQITTGEAAEHYVVEPELVVRESTARSTG